jgi:hypothetical protein
VFAVDQIIIQESEDELLRSVFHLNNMCKGYRLSISTNKIKTKAFKGKSSVSTKIAIEDKIPRTGQSLQVSDVGNPPQGNNRRIVESRVFFGVRSQDNNRSVFFGVRPQAITGKARKEIYSLQSLQGWSLSLESRATTESRSRY